MTPTAIAVVAGMLAMIACKKHEAAAPAPGSGSAPTPAAAKVDPEARARQIVALLARHEAQSAWEMFGPEMKRALPIDKLAADWSGLLEQVGALSTCDVAHKAATGGHDVVVLRCKFASSGLDLTVSFAADGKVDGLHFKVAEAPWSPPPYAAKDAVEREVTVGAAPWQLPATLTLPAGKGPFPAVVLVHGSGPGDRDETIGPNKPFKDLAVGLAASGIAVLRFEKRTKVYGAKLASDLTFTAKEESVDDAVAAADLLRHTAEIDPKRIFVAGHSLGGELAPRIGQGDPKLAGLIILAGSTRPLAKMMREQIAYIGSLDAAKSADVTAQLALIDQAIARLAEIEKGAAAKPDERVLNIPIAYWKDLDGYDAPAAAAKLTLPITVVQGGRDYQVTKVDLERWQAALEGHANATFKLYPKLNHLLFAGDGPPNPKEYETASHVDAEIVTDLAAWIAKH